MSCADVAKTIGQRSLFLGAGTINWSVAQFQQAAQFAHDHGFDTIFVKVGEGTWTWYGGLAGWHTIRQAILAKGVGAVAYFYSKGDSLGGLDGEANLLIEYMREDGIVISDMEQEWNGHADWAARLCAKMKSAPGLFLVSTWGNPYDQEWQGVIKALNPCVASYMPQQYTDYLASCWAQYGALGAACIMPTFMLTQDFGKNNPVANARAAHNQGHTAMSIWYYEPATANPALLDQVLAAFPTRTLSSPQPPQQEEDVPTVLRIDQVKGYFVEKTKDQIWEAKNGFVVGHGMLDYYRKAGQEGLNGLTVLGLPLGNEEPTGIPGAVSQRFERGVLVYDPKHQVDGPPGAGPVYMAHIDKSPGIDPRIAQLQHDNADLITKLKAAEANVGSGLTQARIDEAATSLQSAIAAEQNVLKALGK